MSGYHRGVEYVQMMAGTLMRHRTYTIRLMGPSAERRAHVPDDVLNEAEENISDLLPEGFYVKIEEED